jgi:hypothetical protein
METVYHQDLIYIDSDYSKFKFKPGNRPVIASKISALVQSIQDHNLTDLTPIQVDTNFVIEDGQHRFLALRELGLPIKYRVGPSLTASELISLNVGSSWGTLDAVKARAQEGAEVYVRFLRDFHRSGLSFTAFNAIVFGTKGGQNFLRKITSGNLEYSRQASNDTNIVAQEYVSIFDKYPHYNTATLAIAFHRLRVVPGFQVDVLRRQMKNYGTLLEKQVSNEKYFENLIKIYNYNRPASSRMAVTK